jgi:hypothetical protein
MTEKSSAPGLDTTRKSSCSRANSLVFQIIFSKIFFFLETPYSKKIRITYVRNLETRNHRKNLKIEGKAMKQIIKKFKPDKNQTSICDHIDKEDVERLNAEKQRIINLRERKIDQKEKAEHFKLLTRQNAEDILRIRAARSANKSNL